MHELLVENVIAMVKKFGLQVHGISPLNQFKSEFIPQLHSLFVFGSLWFFRCNLHGGMWLAGQNTLNFYFSSIW